MRKRIFGITALTLSIITASTLYSCKKDTNTTPETALQTTQQKRGSFGSMEQNGRKMRKVTKNNKDCENITENCHPEDIVITGVQIQNLDNAISAGGYGVSTLFSDNEVAIQYVPDWNSPWFSDVKAAILSGQYTFVKANPGVYLLGKEGEVSTDKFDYALVYKF